MTIYREGQLVRWEWPDGTGCTDTLVDVAADLIGRRFRLDPRHNYDGRTVTILKPDEPTGVGAVVAVVRGHGGELWVRVHAGSDRPWHEVLPGTYPEYDACRRTWDQIEVVEVLSPGVDVDALDVEVL